MPTPLPPSVRESWGEHVADDFSRWLEEYVQEHAVRRDEYREILSRLDVLENEVAGINERLDRMEERFEDRFEQMEDRFAHVEERFETRFNQMDKRFETRFNQMDKRFETRFNQMGEHFETRFNQMDERIDRMHEQMRVMMRWTVGTIALFGTIVTVLLAISKFAP